MDMLALSWSYFANSSRSRHVSTSLLYHSVGIIGRHYASQHFEMGQVTFASDSCADAFYCC